MKSLLLGLLTVCLGSLLAATPLVAHHSFARTFDSNKIVTLHGVITKVDWINPHAYLYIDVKDQRVNVENWKMQGAAPNTLRQRGLRIEMLKAGEAITVTGYLPRTGEMRFAHADEVTLPGGQKLLFGMGCLRGNPGPFCQ